MKRPSLARSRRPAAGRLRHAGWPLVVAVVGIAASAGGLLAAALVGASASPDESDRRTVLGPSDQEGRPVTPLVTSRVRGPVPTNAWWSSLAWPFRSPYSENLYPHPLSVAARADGLEIGYPDQQVVEASWFAFPHRPDMVLGVHGLRSADARVDGFSDWDVSALWRGEGTSLRATVAQGSPYVFATVKGAPAEIRFEKTPTLWQRGAETLGLSVDGHHYGLFLPPGGRWTLDSQVARSSFSSGRVSIALLPEPTPELLELFATHAFSWVTGTEVDWSYEPGSGRVESRFRARIEPREGAPAETLFALYPHQWLHARGPFLPGSYRSPRGPMKILVGPGFQTRTPFPGLLPHLPAVATPDVETSRELERMVRSEARSAAPPEGAPGTLYDEGKAMQRLAGLVPIADQLGLAATRDRLLAGLRGRVELWLAGSQGRSLRHEKVWGSLVPSPASHGADSELNDHHLQYGYLLSAAATVARHDPSWAARWRRDIERIVRNVANPRRDDPEYPFLRTFDPYAGHSWASGHGAFAAGNNQESSSEAVHFAAALALWGTAIGDESLRDLGVFLYSHESLAARLYWRDCRRESFPPRFRHPLIGILWGNGGAYGTWWTEGREEIHGINLLPVGPAQLHLGLAQECLGEGFDHLEEMLGAPPRAWGNVLAAGLALVDPSRARRLLASSPEDRFDDGLSRAQTLHWIESLARLGALDGEVHGDSPTSMAFLRGDSRTYVVYNPQVRDKTVRFSDGTSVVAPPGRVVAVRRQSDDE